MYQAGDTILVQVIKEHCDIKTVATSLSPYATGHTSICLTPPIPSWLSFYLTDISSSVSRTLSSSVLKQSPGLKYHQQTSVALTLSPLKLHIHLPICRLHSMSSGHNRLMRPKSTFTHVKVGAFLSLLLGSVQSHTQMLQNIFIFLWLILGCLNIFNTSYNTYVFGL